MIFAIGCFPKSDFTVFPNGKSDSFAILKHCLPNGIPIMVMHQIMPRKNQDNAEKKPVNKNQRLLPIVFIKISLNVLTIVVNFMLSYFFIFVN